MALADGTAQMVQTKAAGVVEELRHRGGDTTAVNGRPVKRKPAAPGLSP